MVRQLPVESLMATAVKARVAVLSRACDSATSEGTKVPPALETGTGVVGLASVGGGEEVTAAAELEAATSAAEVVVSASVSGEVTSKVL